jgi:alcohol dehydrogenase class IV
VKAVRLLSASLVDAVRERDIEALEDLSRASLHAGMAFSNSLLGIVHALAHPIGGRYDTSHGSVNAVLLPEVIRYALPAVEEKLPELAWGLGHRTGRDVDAAAEVVQEAVEELLNDIGAPRHLSSLGVAHEDLRDLAERALEDACILTSPRKATVDDLVEILERAF